jgi:hypothetical protein
MAIIPADEKVFMVDKRTNTTYGGSAALQAMQQWYTMQDVADSVQPYKVFTALVSQSGGTNPAVLTEGAVQTGVTYRLSGVSNASDFSNVGGPGAGEAIDNTYIIAINNEIPLNYGGASLIYDDGAPKATVLENTIGNIGFDFLDTGKYRIISQSLFKYPKTFINGAKTNNDGYAVFNPFVGTNGNDLPSIRGYFFDIEPGNESIIGLSTVKNNAQFENGIIDDPICIEIRVYN